MTHHNLSQLTLEVRQFEVRAFVYNGKNPDRLRLTDETIQGIMENTRFNLRESIYLGNREMNFPQVKIWPVIIEALYFKPNKLQRCRAYNRMTKASHASFPKNLKSKMTAPLVVSDEAIVTIFLSRILKILTKSPFTFCVVSHYNIYSSSFFCRKINKNFCKETCPCVSVN